MVHAWVFEQGKGFEDVENPREQDKILKGEETLLWVDAEAPTPDELEWIREHFQIHRIAMEDYDTPHERSRIDRYPEFYSIVFFALDFKNDQSKFTKRPITLFVGQRFMVSLHADPFPEIEEAKKLWERDCREMHAEIGAALYALMDTLVDDYFPLIDHLAEQVEEIEDEVMDEAKPANLDRIFQLKRELLVARQAVAPERDVMNVLLRRELPLFSERNLIFFQDVYDHLVRILDSLDTHRDLLGGALDLYVSVVSNRLATSANRLNQTMQTLTGWSIILMSASLVAGVYGMNFERMPELKWRYGYPYALALMVFIGVGLWFYFRRRKWV